MDGGASTKEVESAQRNPARVLIIDDEESIRTSLKRYFTKRGWQVFEAGDGRSALQLLAKENAESFALVLCDLRMPGMAGPELHARVKTEFPSILDRLVMVTGDVVSTDAAAFLAQTNCRVLEKPFELRVLTALAEELRGAFTRSRVA
jgi:CheY-like chemotaxis protein